MFDVQGITIQAPAAQAFSYISDPANLPRWTNAFSSVGNGKAMMRTPNGEMEVGLVVHASAAIGNIDWEMQFPDGNTAMAYSRVVPLDAKKCAYSFVLLPPPVPLELLEGALEEQSKTLSHELGKLKSILGNQ